MFDKYNLMAHPIKVGDYVQLKSMEEMDDEFGEEWWHEVPYGVDDEMFEYLGEKLKVTEIRVDNRYGYIFILHNPYYPESEWHWHLSYFKFNADENLI